MKKILVVDDGEEILEGIKIVLEDEGYEVDVLTNSFEVMRYVKENKPNAILIDYMMPGIDGGKVTEKIKKNDDLASIPVIMFSASQELENVASKVGADDTLAKPFDLDILVDKIKKHTN